MQCISQAFNGNNLQCCRDEQRVNKNVNIIAI